MRRLLSCLFTALLVLCCLAGAPAPSTAQAQSAGSVALTLISQSAWNDDRRPLTLTLQAVNLSAEPIGSLAVVLSIGVPTRSRSAYELSLRTGPEVPIFGYSFPQAGAIRPGESRAFKIRQPLDVLTARGETALYPLRVDLSSNDVPIATLRSPLLFLGERPEVPLNLAWTWVLDSPIQFGPDGVLMPGRLESDIAAGGRLDATSKILDRARGRAVDASISGLLVQQLERMARGYRREERGGAISRVPRGTAGAADAARVLSRLRRAAHSPQVEVVSTPFGEPSLPRLAAAGLAADVPSLFNRSREILSASLDAAPTQSVVRPPWSEVDPSSLVQLASLGARTILLDAGSLPSPPDSGFSPAPVVRLQAGRGAAEAILPDQAVARALLEARADARLAAQSLLGELAATWLEFPGTAGRGAAVLFPERLLAPPAFLRAFSSLVRSSPWLRPVKASRLAALTARPDRVVVPEGAYRPAEPGYAARLISARATVADFGRTARGAGPMVARLNQDLLLSEAAAFSSNAPLARDFLDSALTTVRRTYAGVRITPSPVTLFSGTGLIPVKVTNATAFPFSVELRLVADRRLAFVNGNSRTVTLPPKNEVFTFRVHARTTGRFPIKIQVRTPSARLSQTIAETQIVVRSTAYNRVALVLTIGAALFLLGWWGRRLLPRRRS